MTPIKKSQEITIKTNSVRFLLCTKTKSAPPTSDLSRKISRGDNSNGCFQAIEQYERRDKVRISYVIEESGEGVHEKKDG